MGSFREEMFGRIRQDYLINGKNSVLYRFLLEKNKEKLKLKGKTMEEVRAAIEKKAVDYMYNKGFPLSEEKKKRKDAEAKGTDAKGAGAKAADAKGAGAKGATAKGAGAKGATAKGAGAKAAGAKAGKDSKAGSKAGSTERSKGRSNNSALDLIDLFCAENGFDNIVDFDPVQYQKLFEWLNEKKKVNAIVPVRVDPNTGIGFYIVGKKHYYNFPDSYEKKEYSCGIAFMTNWITPWDGDNDEDGHDDDSPLLEYDNSDDECIPFSLNMYDDIDVFANSNAKSYSLADLPSICEANSWFIYELKDRYDFFREANGKCPKDLPAQFRKYFEAEVSATEEFKITPEDIEAARKEVEADLNRRKRGGYRQDYK